MHLTLTNSTLEKVRSHAFGASFACFLETSQLSQGLCKKPDQVLAVDNKIREVRNEYLPLLEKFLSPRQARLEVQVFIDLILRCLLTKPWPTFEKKLSLPAGKYSNEKVTLLGIFWASLVDLRYPDSQFSSSSCLVGENTETQEAQQEVNLEAIRTLKKSSSDAAAPEILPKLKRGYLVTVVRRMSWQVPLTGKEDYRKDLVIGQEGTTHGWADLDQRQVLLATVLDLPEGPSRQVIHACYPRNLQLTSEYQLEKVGSSTRAEEPPSSSASSAAVPTWLLESSDPSAVKKRGPLVQGPPQR